MTNQRHLIRRKMQSNRAAILLITAAAAGLYWQQSGERPVLAHDQESLAVNESLLRRIPPDEVASLGRLSNAFSLIAESVKPSVVNIQSKSFRRKLSPSLKRLLEDSEISLPPVNGNGSGVIVSEDGYIVTNYHVIADAEVILVSLSDHRLFRNVRVVGVDELSDLAVLKIDAKGLQPVVFGDSDAVKVGHLVLAIGSPFKFDQSVSHGIISAKGRSDVGADVDYESWLQTDAPINPGNSGGPLIDTQGRVVGINTAIATDSGGHQGVAFAIPANMVTRVIADLKEGRSVVRGYLGIEIQPMEPKWNAAYGLPETGGVFVARVVDGSPAHQAGLAAEDIILAFNQTVIRSRAQLQDLIASTAPDSEASLTVWRDGAEMLTPVIVGRQPRGFSPKERPRRQKDALSEEDEEEINRLLEETLSKAARQKGRPETVEKTAREDDPNAARFDSLGLAAETVSPNSIREFGLHKEIANGVVVTEADSLGEGFASGLRAGHVIHYADGRRIHNIHELKQIFTEENVRRGVRMRVKRCVGEGEERTCVEYYTVVQVR